MKVISKRNFLREAKGGKRTYFEKGKTYDVSEEEFKDNIVNGLQKASEEKKEDAKK
jgi:hypothetical protein